MSNVYELPERRSPVDEAGDWIAKLDRGLSDQEEVSLREWLAADPNNPAALMESAEVWDKMDSLSRLADMFPQPGPRQTRPAWAPLALAAAALLAVLGGYWSTLGRQLELPEPAPVLAEAPREQNFQTAIGEYSTVTLPDGSQVTLNTNSVIRARFEEHRRLLFLDRGEVYIQVAHDPSRPLSVWVGDRFVEAVGTAFNIAISADQHIELIVTEGKVLVGVVDKATALAAASEPAPRADPHNGNGESPVSVSAGERMVLDDDSNKVEPIEPEELEVRLSWRGGNLIFRGESLAEALAEIERYTPVEFVIMDESLKRVRIIGMFKAGDVDGLLATLRQNFDIAYQRISDDKVILTGKLAQ